MTNSLDLSAIQDLEQFSGLLWGEKADILLTAAGLRPTTMSHLHSEKYTSDEMILRVDPDEIRILENILRALKLSFHTRRRVIDQGHEKPTFHEVVDFFIAKSDELARALKQAVLDWDEKLIGLTLGYPRTAVEAYIDEDLLLDMNKHPVSTPEVSEQNMHLLAHRLSSNSWRDEVKYIENSGEVLKKLSPVIYDKLMP